MPQDFFPYINLFLCGRKFISSRMPQNFFPYSHKFSTVYKFSAIGMPENREVSAARKLTPILPKGGGTNNLHTNHHD